MGKSGSFFFFSDDEKFLIKTMTQDDFRTFKKLFRLYFEHINKYPDSLLARIYGVYSVKMDEMTPVFLILMGNTKPCDPNYIYKQYDLKGSLVKRESPEDSSVLKDKNFLNLK